MIGVSRTGSALYGTRGGDAKDSKFGNDLLVLGRFLKIGNRFFLPDENKES